MTTFCDPSFLLLVRLCPGVAVTDLMRVERLLAPLETASLEDPSPPAGEREQSQDIPYNDCGGNDSSIEEETLGPTPWDDEGPSDSAGQEESAPMISPSEPISSEERCAVDESRLEDYVYYDVDSGHEVRCGQLFGGEHSGGEDTGPHAVQASEGSRNPKNWKLDINMRLGRDDSTRGDGDHRGGGGEGPGAVSDYIHVRFKHISFLLVPCYRQEESIKRSMEEAFGPIAAARHQAASIGGDPSEQLTGGVLVLAPKASLGVWEGCARNHYSSSFHSYTAPLSQRRKFGAARLSTFDAVITTLGVLTAKECSVPAFALTDDAGYESNEESLGDRKGASSDDSDSSAADGSDNWLRRRRGNNMAIDASYLHLLRWKKIIVEVDEKTRLKPNAVKTDAVLKLRTDCIEYHYISEEEEEGGVRRAGGADRRQVEAEAVKSLKIFRDVSDMYTIPSSVS